MRLMTLGMVAVCLLPGAAYAQDCPDIGSRICTLKVPYDPEPTATTPNPDPPACVATTPDPITTVQKTAIQVAYQLLPSRIRGELCKTNFYLIDNSGGNAHRSFGRWESPVFHPQKFGDTQIAINSDDLSITFSDKQEQIFEGLGINNYGKHLDEVIPGRWDPQMIGLLYVIAHELGHIKWHKDAAVSDVGCTDDANFYSWADISTAKAQRWTDFKKEDLGEHKNLQIKKPKDVQNSDHLKSIYTGGFVTALAATNPEEDFVETYAVRILMEICPLCEFYVGIPKNNSVRYRINDHGGNLELKAKFDCIYNKYIR